MKKLQVLINDNWEYVFCKNEREVLFPVITKNPKKAITERAGDCQRILEYFSRYFTSLEFRLV
jgi:hypothetical protein